MKKFHKYSTKSFTLIELLVVLAIVGLLTSAILPSLNKSRLLARDEKRLAELQQIKKAVKMYYASNGFYPRNGIGIEITYAYDKDSLMSSWVTLENSLKTAINTIKLPKDPSSKPSYYYTYSKISSSANLWGDCKGHFVLYANFGESSSFKYRKQECPNISDSLPYTIIVDLGKY